MLYSNLELGLLMFIQQSLKRLLLIQFYVEMHSSYDFLGWDCCLLVLGLRAL